jgi:hypothetical protein
MTCNNELRYEFGPSQLDPSKRIPTRDGAISLTPCLREVNDSLAPHEKTQFRRS